MIRIVPLRWDSAFFRLRIAKTEIKSISDIELLLQNKTFFQRDYDLIYVFSTLNDPSLSKEMQLVDKKATYLAQVIEGFNEQPSVKLWEISSVSPELLSLALLSGKYSRFFLDKHFPQGSYEKLYAHWIQQSVNHSLATEVFCYMDGDKPRGMLTLDRKDEIGTIGLVSVDSSFRQRGIGTSLIRHAMYYSCLNQIKKLYVVTQRVNTPACQLYEKNGFTLDSVVDVWHWWL